MLSFIVLWKSRNTFFLFQMNYCNFLFQILNLMIMFWSLSIVSLMLLHSMRCPLSKGLSSSFTICLPAYDPNGYFRFHLSAGCGIGWPQLSIFSFDYMRICDCPWLPPPASAIAQAIKVLSLEFNRIICVLSLPRMSITMRTPNTEFNSIQFNWAGNESNELWINWSQKTDQKR